MPISFSKHAAVRLWQRYGLRPTLGLRQSIGRAIDALRPPEGCVSNLSVPYRHYALRVVYDARHREIVTFLPDIDARPDSAA